MILRSLLWRIIGTGGLILSSFFPAATHAQADYVGLGKKAFSGGVDAVIKTKLGARDPSETAAYVITALLGLLGIVAIVLIIYAGLMWMLSRGNEEQITKARNIMLGAVIGLLIILASYAITLYVFGVLLESTNAPA